MEHTGDFLGRLASAMQELGFSSDVELEVAIGGSQTYEIDGAGTRWAPLRGTRNFNQDAFIVIRKPSPVIPSNA